MSLLHHHVGAVWISSIKGLPQSANAPVIMGPPQSSADPTRAVDEASPGPFDYWSSVLFGLVFTGTLGGGSSI